MKAIILVAGASTRMYPLTLARPKTLIPVANLSIIEHILAALDGLVDEIVLVIGHEGNQIREALGEQWRNISIQYVEQPTLRGTGDAVLRARVLVKGSFLVIMGDDLYCREDIASCLDDKFPFPYRILATRVENPEQFGVLSVEGDEVTGIVEKPKAPASNLANSGMYLLDDSIFDILQEVPPSARGEIELTDAIQLLAARGKLGVRLVSRWRLAVGYPWDILSATEVLLRELSSSNIQGNVHNTATLRGNVTIGPGSTVGPHALLNGPLLVGEGTLIGEKCTLRGFSAIGSHCNIGEGATVDNSVIFNHCQVEANCVIPHSVLGEGVHFGLGSVVITDRESPPFGVAIGDGVRISPDSRLHEETHASSLIRFRKS